MSSNENIMFASVLKSRFKILIRQKIERDLLKYAIALAFYEILSKK